MLLKRAVDRNTKQTHGLDRPATNPPGDLMLIESSLIPWKIHIHAHPSPGYVSIADVLNGIYDALQEPITESEYERLDRGRAKAVEAAYFRRIDQESTRSGEPIKKIDWLEGRYVFEGLQQSGTDQNAWILRLGWPRRR
ncbi:hypothetical protein BU17DRAFT_57602 [Hysterangium stoloniferum]|nr:hypothetical protein BU17DRAFT_57602 [Hysterangium stoloniferum]